MTPTRWGRFTEVALNGTLPTKGVAAVYGEEGGDTVEGGRGNDYLFGSPGQDDIDGGPATTSSTRTRP
ncbi:hypothetical protein [Streptomyces sp. Inha503]|uniref:hypothetical protein n=1 Tax=Streptomyces sp. Inha503 TaxID=3383314 RepID=UPI0039A053BB